MANAQPKFLAATAVGITLSSCFVGVGLSLSWVAIPGLLLPSPAGSTSKPSTSNPQLARQWRLVYDQGKATAVPFAIGSALSFAYAALQLPSSLDVQRYLYIASATLSVLVIPYTLTVMHPTNTVLMLRAAEGDAMKEEVGEGDVTEVGMPATKGVEGQRTEDLLRSWAALNVVRAVIPLAGIGCAITALVW